MFDHWNLQSEVKKYLGTNEPTDLFGAFNHGLGLHKPIPREYATSQINTQTSCEELSKQLENYCLINQFTKTQYDYLVIF